MSAPLPPPINLVATAMTNSILLTWDLPLEGLNAVDSYELYYEYAINQCSGNESMIQPVAATIADGTLRSFTIENSSSTPVEEDSVYSVIRLRAVNSVDRSVPSNTATARTDESSEQFGK